MPKEIPLSQGKVMIVDDCWHDKLLEMGSWYFHEGYAVRKERIPGEKNKWRIYRAHRVVAKCDDPDLLVDHINGNKLDNQEHNLRIATKAENNRNVKKTWDSSSKYKGVTYQEGLDKPWIAQIGYEGKRIYLGSYHHEKTAANMYNLAAKQLFGEFADLNDLDS
jgi:hypothetical protein